MVTVCCSGSASLASKISGYWMATILLEFAAFLVHGLFAQPPSSVATIEIQALKDLYFATNGAYWYNNTNWDLIFNPNKSICLPQNLPFGVKCDSSQQHIKSIIFQNNGLNGTLPSNLSNLHFLQEFVFDDEVGLNGTIPESLYSLTHLETFKLIGVNLNGTISDSISNWIDVKTLKTLHFVNTWLSGSVPSSIWYIDSLIDLDLEINFNNLTIIISDEMCNLKNIQWISLSDSVGAHGVFPGDCICSNWTHLTQIFLGYWANKDVIYDIYGDIPDCLWEFENITEVSIRNTRLSGIFANGNNIEFNNKTLSTINMGGNHNLTGALCTRFILAIMQRAVDLSNDGFFIDMSFNNLTEFGTSENNYDNDISDLIVIDTNNGDVNQIFNYYTNFLENIVNSSNCYFQFFSLKGNNLESEIPQYLFANCRFSWLSIDSNKLYGSLPHNLIAYVAEMGTNNFNGSIPRNIFSIENNEFYPSTGVLSIENNQLSGAIPNEITNGNNVAIEEIYLSNNCLNKLPQNVNSTYLQVLEFDNNDIVEYNIGTWLKDTFDNAPQLYAVTLHKNSQLGGDIGKWDKYGLSNGILNLTMLTLHSCNIYGTISNDLRFRLGSEKTSSGYHFRSVSTYFTLFNNRISGPFPSHLFSFNPSNEKEIGKIENRTALVILGNLFYIDEKSTQSSVIWFEEAFLQANNLYLTSFENDLMYGCFALACVCCLVSFIFRFMVHRKIKNNNIEDQMLYGGGVEVNQKQVESQAFLDTIGIIVNLMSNVFILTISLILSGMYFVYSGYYDEGRFVSHFSLTYWIISDDTDSKIGKIISQIGLIIIYILMNGYFVFELIKLHTEQVKFRYLHFNENRNTRKCCKCHTCSGILYQCFKYKYKCNKFICESWLNCILWCFIYIASIAFTIFASISENVPRHNVFGINSEWQAKLLSIGLVIMVTLSSIYIVRYFGRSIETVVVLHRKLVDISNGNKQSKEHLYNPEKLKKACCAMTWEYTPTLLMISRSWLSIGVPLIGSIILLNDCGSAWALFWNKCKPNRTDFDLENTIWYWENEIIVQSDVCGLKSINDLTKSNYFNPCLRQFWDWWIPIVCIKLILLTLYIACKTCFWKYLKYKCFCYNDDDVNHNNCKNKCCDGCTYTCWRKITSIDEELRAESEYSTLATNLEIVFMFCTISPYIVAFGTVSVVMLQYYYKLLLSEKEYDKLRRESICSNSIGTSANASLFVPYGQFGRFPVHFLFLSLCVQQFFLCVFLSGEFEKDYLWLIYVLIACFVIMDCLYLTNIVRKTAKNVHLF